jgi:hypothetical protein
MKLWVAAVSSVFPKIQMSRETKAGEKPEKKETIVHEFMATDWKGRLLKQPMTRFLSKFNISFYIAG